MKIKNIIEEDFVNYFKPSMFILFNKCSFKCDKEAGCTICQNSILAHEPDIKIDYSTIVDRYINNPITKAIVFGGLEPFDTPEAMLRLIEHFRQKTQDDIVIYTGYTEEELSDKLLYMKKTDEYLTTQGRPPIYNNIIIKFGRFIPNQEKHYDEVLGVELASPNQYARRIS